MDDVRNSQWAHRFQKECPSQFEKALELAADPELEVTICYNNDNGSWVHAVAPVSLPDFWFDAFPSRRKAVQFCHSMNWKIRDA